MKNDIDSIRTCDCGHIGRDVNFSGETRCPKCIKDNSNKAKVKGMKELRKMLNYLSGLYNGPTTMY